MTDAGVEILKKLLFIVFFPITVPVYLMIKLFGWIKDSFVPFVTYDVIPFIDEHIFSKAKEYASYKAEQMQEKEKTEEQVSDLSNAVIKQENDYQPPLFTSEEYRKSRYRESKEQSDILKKCFESNLYNDYYTCGEIFNFWGARYRLLAIDRFEHCLQIRPNATIYHILGDLYEKDHRFQDAQEMYQNEINKMPEYPAGYICVSRCLLKQNKIDEALAFLNEAKSTEYYLNPKPHSSFDTCIDDKYQELTEKKSRGYTFKQRKKICDYIQVGTMSIDEICADYLKKWQ